MSHLTRACGCALLLATSLGCGATPSAADASLADVAVVETSTADVAISLADVPPTTADVVSAADAGVSARAELPPTTGATDIEAWLAEGHYLAWRCEPERHAARPGSAHSANRICSNARLSGAEGDGEYPVGAASVKELFGSGGAITGYAVGVRVSAGSAPSAWYWYERLAPGRVVADSTGDRGGARTICASCHMGAPRDNVFTRVR